MLKNSKWWLKNRTFQALLLCNIIVVALTGFFSLATPLTILNFEIHASGWTSIAALALGDYLGMKAIKTERQVSGFFESADIKKAIIRIDQFLQAFDEFATTPEFLEFFQNFNKALKTLSALEDKINVS
jgi:hypothetical protein